MRVHMLILVGLTGTLLVGWRVEARRVVSVTPKCPTGASSLMIDQDGTKDVCVGTVVVVCSDGQALLVDRKGEEDRCVASSGASEGKPACPDGYQWKPKVGADECVQRAQPICPRGFDLKARPGEDACVY
jgi:hypothetical protein